MNGWICWYSWSQFGVWYLVISYGLICSLMLTRGVWWDVKTDWTRPIWLWFWVFQVFSGKGESLAIHVNIKWCDIVEIALECHSEIQKPRTEVWGGWMGLEQTKLCGFRLSGSLTLSRIESLCYTWGPHHLGWPRLDKCWGSHVDALLWSSWHAFSSSSIPGAVGSVASWTLT